jgi:hypothetical protein
MRSWKKWVSLISTAILIASFTMFVAWPRVEVRATAQYIGVSINQRNYSTYVEINQAVAASADDSSSRGGYSNTAGEGGFGVWNYAAVSSAFRFTGINLPTDAVIDTAYVKLTAQYSRGDDILSAIYVENNATPVAYGASENYTSRTYFPKVDWDFTTNWAQDTVYNTSSLVAQIQALVDIYGAYSNGAIAAYVTDDGNAGSWDYRYQATYPYDTSTAKAAVLYIYYHTDGLTVISKIVAASADDSCSSPSYSNTNGEQRMGDISDTESKCAYRFTGITIPAGATISRAKLVFTAQYTRVSTPALIISGEDTLNPATYGATEDFSSRTYSTATVNWTTAGWTANNVYSSSDIKTIIDELYASYTYDNDEMAFMIVGNANITNKYQVAFPYDSSTAKAAKLLIYYISPSLTNAGTESIGAVATNTTYYAKGSAPANPESIADGDCAYTLTNDSAISINVNIHGHAFTSAGVGWTLTSGAAGEDTVRIKCYHTGDGTANYITLTTGDQELYHELTASSHTHWDLSLETGTFTHGNEQTGIITLTAVVH